MTSEVGTLQRLTKPFKQLLLNCLQLGPSDITCDAHRLVLISAVYYFIATTLSFARRDCVQRVVLQLMIADVK